MIEPLATVVRDPRVLLLLVGLTLTGLVVVLRGQVERLERRVSRLEQRLSARAGEESAAAQRGESGNVSGGGDRSAG